MRCALSLQNIREAGSRRLRAGLLAALLLRPGWLPAEPIAVHYREGSVHGFLVLRSQEGKVLAGGELTQSINGDRAVCHVVFRFRDGSIDDETSIFSQHGTFRLISDRHIQKGPMFPQAADVSINALTGEVTVRYKDKDREKVETERLDLPPDLANGIVFYVLKNISPETKETKVSYVAATPKPRLVKLAITPSGEETFSVAGFRHKAMRFTLKPELGGIAGVIAPLVGKKPPDTEAWVIGGKAPSFVRLEGPLYLGGPIWNVELSSPVWPRAPSGR